jgi:L-ascorbate metabolism protein UlaG (beta-lactamase superfamily)
MSIYLRSDIMMEPLVDYWYAWPLLIPPATAARNISERHLRIMDSYIQGPAIHAAAVKNPQLIGGPFMDYCRNEVEAIEKLRRETIEKRRLLLELSDALADLERVVAAEATGHSLESLYQKVPPALKGYVEVTYDTRHQAAIRLIEPLLYRSRFYDPSMQSVMLSAVEGDDRPFVLSTPRLETDDNVHLRVPFSHRAVDALFRMTHSPGTKSGVEDLLGLADDKQNLFRAFFTDERPPSPPVYDGPGARWRYFGHACVLIETSRMSVMVDPVISYMSKSRVPRYTYRDLPRFIDYVLITHHHQDHMSFETLLQLRHRVGTIIVPRNGGGAIQDPSLKLILQQCGFDQVVEISEMEEIKTPSGGILAAPFLGEHGDLSVQSKTGYLVRAGQHSILFAADTCNVERALYRHVHREIGDVDVLFLGMECDGAPVSWLYGPLFTDKIARDKDHSRRLAGSNYERAICMVEDLRCKEAYIYAMGQEPWLNYIMSIKYTEQSLPIIQSNMLLEACRKRCITAERLFGEKQGLLN